MAEPRRLTAPIPTRPPFAARPPLYADFLVDEPIAATPPPRSTARYLAELVLQALVVAAALGPLVIILARHW